MKPPPFNAGPWATGDGNPEVIYAGKGTNRFEIATVAGPTAVVPYRETYANSKLIAAAPDLLGALDPRTLQTVADLLARSSDPYMAALVPSLRDLAACQFAALALARGGA